MKTNDPVLLSFVEALLRDADIGSLLADTNISVMEGSIGIFPKRLLVEDGRFNEACQLMRDADLGQWITAGD